MPKQLQHQNPDHMKLLYLVLFLLIFFTAIVAYILNSSSSERKKELDKVKALIIGNTKMSLEATDDIANYYGSQELMKKEIKTLEKKIKEIKKVTVLDIQKMAKIIFKTKNLNLAIIGPYKENAQFVDVLKF